MSRCIDALTLRRLLVVGTLTFVGALALEVTPARAETAAPPVSVVAPQASAKYELVVDGGEARLLVPLTVVDSVPPVSIRARVTGARSGENISQRLEGFFAAEADLRDGPALAVTVRFARDGTGDERFLAPGTYGIDVRMDWTEGTGAAAKVGKAVIPVTVVIPSATLDANGPLQIDRTMDCLATLFCVHTDTTKSALVLDETSKLAPVHALVGDQRGITHDGNPSGGVAVELPANVADIARGARGQAIAYETEGDFRIGKTTGTLRLTSPTMTTPVAITWTAHTKRGPLSYLVVIGFGLLLGVLVRKGLSTIVDRGDRRRQVQEKLDALRVEAQHRPDQVFRDEVNRILAELATRADAAGYAEAAQIDELLKAADTDLGKAVDDLGERRSTLADMLRSYSSDLANTGDFIPILGIALQSARASLAAIEPHVKADEVQGATDLLEAQTRTTLADFRVATATWSAANQSLVQHLTSPGAPLPSGVQPLVSKLLATFTDALAKPDFVQPTTVAGSQNAVAVAVNALRNLVKLGLAEVVAEADELNQALVKRGITTGLSDAIQQADAVVKEFDAKSARGSKAVADATGRLLGELAELFARQPVDASDAEAYRAALRAGDYRKAHALISAPAVEGQAAAKEAPADQRILGRGPAYDRVLGAAETSVAVLRGQFEPLVVPTPQGLPKLGVLSAPGAVITDLARALRWLVLALVVVLAAALVLPEMIDGTNVQLVGVFLWAFTLDLAYNGLLGEAAKLVQAPALPKVA